MENKINETGCCPRFNPEGWDGKEIVWNDKLFAKDHVASFFHMPLNFGQVMARIMAKISAAGAAVPENMIVSDETSVWGSDIYIAVDRDIPGAKMARLSGTFIAKVFEGSYKDMAKWIEATNSYVAAKGKPAKKLYFFYTTCPKCAKVYGKNYVVILAQV